MLDIWRGLARIHRTRGFAAAVLANVAVGIGATVAVFSLVYGVLFRPLPFPNRDRIVRLSEEHAGVPAPFTGVISNLTFTAWTENGLRTLDRIAAYRPDEYLVAGIGDPVLVRGADVSPDVFPLVGAIPALGRFFAADDATEGADHVVVLADGFWREYFAGDPGVVGRTLMVWGEPYTIVGVAGPDLSFPDRDTRLWTPFVMPSPAGTAGNPHVTVFHALGLLKRGATVAHAAAEGTAAARRIGATPGMNAAFGSGGAPLVRARPLAEAMTTGVRPALLLLSVGVGVLLLGVCANLITLFLFHGASQQREVAVRIALGAELSNIVRQLLAESFALTAIGGALGVGLAWMLIRVATVVMPATFPRLEAIRLDAAALAFAVAITMVAAVVSGLWPAFRSGRVAPADVLHGGSGGSTAGFGALRARAIRHTLLAVQSAFAVVLLVTAALLARSFATLMHVDAGYSPAGALAATIYVPGDDGAQQRRFQLMQALLERLRAMPDVVAAGAANMAPLDAATVIGGFPVPRESGTEQTELRFAQARVYTATVGYAEALGLRLIKGRLFTRADFRPGVRPWVVNEEFARLYLPQHPLDRRYVWSGKPLEIVGLVRNVLKDGYDRPPQPEIYVPFSENERVGGAIRIVVRARGDGGAVTPALRNAARQLAPDAAVQVEPLTARVAASVAQPRFASQAMAIFALLAATLSSLGVYGVLAYSVSRRHRELGIRAALGGGRRDLVALVLREGLGASAFGMAIGLLVAAATTDLMRDLLFGIAPLDPIAFAVAPALLIVVVMAACLVPARRAASIDPLEALRRE